MKTGTDGIDVFPSATHHETTSWPSNFDRLKKYKLWQDPNPDDFIHHSLPASIMNRCLFFAAAATAAASVVLAGPLLDLQWQDSNNRLVAFVPESPSAVNQDATAQTFPVLNTDRTNSQLLAESDPAIGNIKLPQQGRDGQNDDYLYDGGANPPSEPSFIFGNSPTDIWTLTSFQCKAQASVCCSQENRLGSGFIQIPSLSKACASSSFPPIH